MPKGNFEFKGTGLGFLWLYIWTCVLTLLTIGLFFPWAMSATQTWIAKNTYVDGKQCTFKGTGVGFFGNWLLILILTLITIGIYAPWGYCRVKKWIVNNTYFAEVGDVEKVT